MAYTISLAQCAMGNQLIKALQEMCCIKPQVAIVGVLEDPRRHRDAATVGRVSCGPEQTQPFARARLLTAAPRGSSGTQAHVHGNQQRTREFVRIDMNSMLQHGL